jgi:hypothetical protein
MTGPDNFILRWARLKRASDTAHERDTASADAKITPAQPLAEGVPDEPFDLASLPSIESIAGDTDVGAFLQSGVPAELARAALRRAWANDPAIRDFVGVAENQWDFNDPDAIPGFGSLLATDGVPAVPAQIVSKSENLAEAVPDSPVSVRVDRSRIADPEPKPDEPCSADSGISDSPNKTTEVAVATKRDRPVEEYDVFRDRRKHGSALPR